MIITKNMLTEKVPREMFPTRLDSALNLYTCIKDGLIVYNIYPDTWNCLYPFFEMKHKFTIDSYEFKNKDVTYGELLKEYMKEYNLSYEVAKGISKESRKEILLSEFSKTFGVEGGKIKDELDSVFELKYSKSKKVWTLYYFENYVLGEIGDIDALLAQKVYEQKFLPLDTNILQIDGVDVVSNLPYILESEENVKKLEENQLR